MKATITLEGKDYDRMPDLWEDDEGQNLQFTIQQFNDGFVNLTGGTVTFKIKEINADVNKVSAACTLTNPAGGICTYSTQATDLDAEGVYDAELEVDLTTSVTTIYLGRFRINADLP